MTLLYRIKIKKIGKNKLILYLPKFFREKIKFNFGDIVKLRLLKGNKSAISISKFHYIITIKNEIVSLLDLKEGDDVKISVEKAHPIKIPLTFLNDGKIDLLFFYPPLQKKAAMFL